MFYLNTLFMDWKVEHDRHWNLLTLLTVNTDFLECHRPDRGLVGELNRFTCS